MSGDPGASSRPTANYDVKKDRRDLYSGRAGRFDVVDVPEMSFLMADGHGDPNLADDYRRAVEALYTTAYAIRAAARSRLGLVHTVGPLEGLWYADDLSVFTARDKGAWYWTMMIWQPEWITPDVAASALDTVGTKKIPGVKDLVRYATLVEGPAIQTLHVGPYDAEGPTIARIHDEVLPGHGMVAAGRHHEIYLSDPRKTPPDRLRTILRQPAKPSQ
ncbi:GyrI-like domain-containing protein [Dietzia sp. NPDC055340]